MIGERTLNGFEITLRPCERGRYVTAVFLFVWLCGWAVGESFAVWFLVKGGVALITGRPPEPDREPLVWGPAVFAGLFLVVWLALWTLGGVAAMAGLLKAVWSADRLVVLGGRLAATWQRGPLRFRRTFERDAMQRLLLTGRSGELALEVGGARVQLSSLGTPDERREAKTALEAELALPSTRGTAALPSAWEAIVTPEGERALVPNRRTRTLQARVAAGIAFVLGSLIFVTLAKPADDPSGRLPAYLLFALTIAATVGVMRLARGRKEWRFGNGRLTLRRRYGSTVRNVFEARRLVLDVTSDSDGDEWFELYALDERHAGGAGDSASVVSWGLPKHRKTVARLMDDEHTIRDLATWLSRESGIAIDDRTSPERRASDLVRATMRASRSGARDLSGS